MNPLEMLKAVGQRFPLIIRNQYHAQIRIREKLYHNIWVTHYGLKVQFCGNRRSQVHQNLNKLLDRLAEYDYSADSDLAMMSNLEKLIARVKGKSGVFCDAGFKEGKSKLAAIRIFEYEIDLYVRESEAYATNTEAEIGAIRLALKRFPDAPEIFSDSVAAICELEMLNEVPNHQRLRWIGRDSNTKADHFANLRK